MIYFPQGNYFMDKKITLQEAMMLMFELKNAFHEEFQKHDYDLTHDALMSLYMLKMKWGFKAKLSDIKNGIKANHNFEEFKKIEVMLSKRFTLLEEKGCITRNKDDHDKREVIIEVTPKGQKIIETFLANVEKRWEEK